MDVGYCRVSTEDQNLDLQRGAMERAGVVKVFEDKASGKTTKNRPGLAAALACMREGDTLVVWRLDRLARSAIELGLIAEKLQAEGKALRSLTEVIDTGTALGKCMFQMIAAFAEFERNVLVERTKAGLEAAKRRGAKFGRKNVLTEVQAAELVKMIRDTDLSIAAIARVFKISKTAVYNYCPGGRDGLRERDEAARLLAEAASE